VRLTRLEPLRVPVNRRGDWLFPRLRAGEITALGDGTSSGDDAACSALWTGPLTDLLAGKDLLDTDARADELLAWAAAQGGDRLHATAVSALEQALWDLRGRVEGKPICELLGGARRQVIPLYANLNRGTWDRSPEGFADRARAAVEDGFDAIKIAPFDEVTRHLTTAEARAQAEAGLRRVAAVRAAIGSDVLLRVEYHHRFDVESAVAVAARLAEWAVDWVEEVTRGLRPADLAAVRARITQSTAGGEALFGLRRFREWADAGAVDVLMPDVKQCGGLREALRVAELAAERGLGCSLHNPHSPLGTAFSLHVCAAAERMGRLEYQWREAPGSEALIKPPERPVHGRLAVPDGPGVGVELRPWPPR